MSAEEESETVAEVFSCRICDDVMLDPTTLPCCGKSFCRRCLRQWIRTSVHAAGVPRCPGGCTAKLPVRLPARAHALADAIEQLLPVALKRRRREAEEEEEPDGESCYGGMRAWQEVAANRDIIFGNALGVRQGTPGVVVGNFSDGLHVTVRFDEREDGSELCVNVLPEALMAPLPGGFRLGHRVVALFDLMLNNEIGVRLGTGGLIVGRAAEDRLMVVFDARADSGTAPSHQGPVSVSYREVTRQRPLVGGFSIAQRVQSAMDLIVGNRVVVRAGTCGSVLAEFSDTRLTVLFDPHDSGGGGDGESNGAGGSGGCFNVLPLEIKPWCALPHDLPAGCRVEALMDLLSMNSVVVRAGARGVVLGGVDEARVFVSFENGLACQTLTVERSLLQKVDSEDPYPEAVHRWSTWPPTSLRQATERPDNADGGSAAIRKGIFPLEGVRLEEQGETHDGRAPEALQVGRGVAQFVD